MQPDHSKQKPEVIDPEMLLGAYASGFFPMADHRDGAIHWYSPDPRAVIPLDQFHLTRSLRQTMKKNFYEIRIDTVFEEVIRSCSDRAETWISEEIVQSYLGLHRLGFAHSVEAWRDRKLSGGLYGVTLRGAFFGESMFKIKGQRSASRKIVVFKFFNYQISYTFLFFLYINHFFIHILSR